MVVKIQPGEPGESEYSWGRGLMAPPDRGYAPTTAEQLHALYRNDKDPTNTDGSAVPNYDDVVRETGLPVSDTGASAGL